LLSFLPLEEGCTTVDVGAGGFCGVCTTDPILEVLGGTVVCVEPVENLCIALREKYNGRVSVIQGFYGDVGARVDSDLVIIEIDSSDTELIFEKLIYFAIKDGLKIGGFIIAFVILDVHLAYPASGSVLNVAGKEPQLKFMRRFFGAESLTPQIVAEAFKSDRFFEFVGMADRYVYGSSDGLGWIVLRRVA
jgi:hypothetical protein